MTMSSGIFSGAFFIRMSFSKVFPTYMSRMSRRLLSLSEVFSAIPAVSPDTSWPDIEARNSDNASTRPISGSFLLMNSLVIFLVIRGDMAHLS